MNKGNWLGKYSKIPWNCLKKNLPAQIVVCPCLSLTYSKKTLLTNATCNPPVWTRGGEEPPPINVTPIALHVLPTSSHDRWKPWSFRGFRFLLLLPSRCNLKTTNQEFLENQKNRNKNNAMEEFEDK